MGVLADGADGADRLVADIYLEVFQKEAKLIVPMPFNQKRYMEDFDSESKEEFLEYLKIADEVFEVENTQGCNIKALGFMWLINQIFYWLFGMELLMLNLVEQGILWLMLEIRVERWFIFFVIERDEYLAFKTMDCSFL